MGFAALCFLLICQTFLWYLIFFINCLKCNILAIIHYITIPANHKFRNTFAGDFNLIASRGFRNFIEGIWCHKLRCVSILYCSFKISVSLNKYYWAIMSLLHRWKENFQMKCLWFSVRKIQIVKLVQSRPAIRPTQKTPTVCVTKFRKIFFGLMKQKNVPFGQYKHHYVWRLTK